ncbi:electron transfer flavoprotein subunit alpha/FixB family protein [Magnetococcus sp. PR-3]|uniref:electron transfer flavoprotein subunit alpha/FixB family protein n=1 Tax=Magnetococcus sp. PR-3 TaxID=3120355 RepID=UPI002FCDE83D
MADETILVVAELQGNQLNPATAHAVAAAQQIAPSCTLLVVGPVTDEVLQTAASLDGVSHVHHQPAALEICTAENLALVILERFKALQASHLFMAESTWSKDLLPRIGALLGVQPLTGVVSILDAQTFIRPTYAGNALVTLRCQEGPVLATVRITAFAAVDHTDKPSPVINGPAIEATHATRLVEISQSTNERPDLRSSAIVVCGGQALEKGGDFTPIEQLADALGGAVAATRSAVDAGLASNDLQVGQTGKVVAPKLYVAVGLSGAIQHLAGMKDSGCIVAINSDPGAPIHAVADYRLVADLYEALPQWQRHLG